MSLLANLVTQRYPDHQSQAHCVGHPPAVSRHGPNATTRCNNSCYIETTRLPVHRSKSTILSRCSSPCHSSHQPEAAAPAFSGAATTGYPAADPRNQENNVINLQSSTVTPPAAKKRTTPICPPSRMLGARSTPTSHLRHGPTHPAGRSTSTPYFASAHARSARTLAEPAVTRTSAPCRRQLALTNKYK